MVHVRVSKLSLISFLWLASQPGLSSVHGGGAPRQGFFAAEDLWKAYSRSSSAGPSRAELLAQRARKAAAQGIVGVEDPLLTVSSSFNPLLGDCVVTS